MRLTAILLGVAALSSCGEASDLATGEDTPPPRASEYRSPRVQQAVEFASDLARTRGFSPTEGPWRGFLVQQGSEVRERAMRAGSCYLVIAAASSAVRELVVRVFDSDGAEVAADGRGGARATLRYCPAQSGTYYLAVLATGGSGLFEARTFRGPTGLEIRLDDIFREPPLESVRDRR